MAAQLVVNMETQIKQFILKALAAAGGTPVPDATLRAVTRNAFPHVAVTVLKLNDAVEGLKTAKLIDDTDDGVSGRVWLLTPAGVIRAKALA